MDRRAALTTASPLLMRAAAGAAHVASSGQASLERRVSELRNKLGPDEAKRLRVPFLTHGEAKALNVGPGQYMPKDAPRKRGRISAISVDSGSTWARA